MENFNIIIMKDVEAEQVSFLWKPYIAYGKLTIVQGDPGCGKTTMMLAVAAAVTMGKPIADSGKATHPLGVIFQTAEDGLADTIKPRLKQLGADCSRVYIIDENEGALSLTDDRIAAAITRTGSKLLILDPIQAYLGGADMHSAIGVRPLMKHLASVAESTGAAIVLIGHLNKNGAKSAYRGLGSIDIYAAARSVLTVGKIDVDENMSAIVHGKSNLTLPGVSLAFGLDPKGGFCWLGEHQITLDELLDGKRVKSDGGMLSYATGFLKSEISNGRIAAVDIYSLAEENGIPRRTLERAKANLNIRSDKIGTKWFWIPEERDIAKIPV